MTEQHAPQQEERRRLTVLVADDDLDLREAIVDALMENGSWNVIAARDGQEALTLALSTNPDVIVLDHRMPVLTGAEVVHRLRTHGAAIPIVLVTAARDVAELARGLGVECFLGKPFGLAQLGAVIERALSGGC